MEHVKIPKWLIVIPVLTLIIGAVWLPFPLNRLDMSDTYGNMLQLQREFNQQGIFAPLHMEQRGRRLLYLTMGIGFKLSPGNFVGHQIVLITVLWLKAFFAYLVMRRLLPTVSFIFPLLFGVMFALYPGDEDHFYFTTANAHITNAALFMAMYTLLLLGDEKRVIPNVLLIPLMVIFVTLGISYNEAVQAFMLATPVIIFLWQRWHITPRRALILLIWYVTDIIWAYDFINRMRSGTAVHSQAVNNLPDKLLPAMDGIIQSAIYLFTGAWARLFTGGIGLWATAIAVSVVVAAILWRYIDTDSHLSRRDTIGLVLLGVLSLIFGYLPYSITAYNYTYTHTLFLSFIGSSLLIMVLLHFISQRLGHRKSSMMLIFVVALTLTVRGSLGTHQHYLDSIESSSNNIETVTELFPSFNDYVGMLIVIDDIDNTSWHDDIFGKRMTSSARYASVIQYIYNDEIPVCMYFLDIGELRGCTAEGGEQGFKMAYTSRPYTFDKMIVFEFDTASSELRLLESVPDDYFDFTADVSVYDPLALSQNCIPYDSRVDTLFHPDVPDC